MLSQIVVEYILIFFIIIFRENKTWHFMWILFRADNSHEMASFIFLKK